MRHPSDLELDFREREGFQIGKAAALSDWEFRKEDNAFKALCSRLYQRNWARAERKRNPEGARARLQRWRDANRERVRAMDRARRAKRRKPLVCVCEECKTPFSPARRSRFCTQKCRNRRTGRDRKPRSRGLRNMELAKTVLSVLGAAPWLTRKEILERAPGAKPGSLATKLTVWTQEGVLVRQGHRYALPEAARG